MRFWDTSAIAALCVAEPASPMARTIALDDPSMVVWWATRTECVSALARRVREGGLSGTGERQARDVLRHLAQAWTEIQPNESLRDTAERLLAVHALRAADAFQLAAASQWCRGDATNNVFVSFDARLREAGYREGFTVLPMKIARS